MTEHPAITVAFAERCLINMAEAAALLGIDEKTLRYHVKRGDLSSRTIGTGSRHRFGQDDILDFLERMRCRVKAPEEQPARSRRNRKGQHAPQEVYDFTKPRPK